MIPDDVVERVRASADIVQLIGESVRLKRSGSDWRGPCPFHNGKDPNFSVSPKRNSYHCFVCHESGDVFTFVRKKFGMDWPSAVKYVGERFGIEVVDIPARAQAPDPNQKNWELLATAAAWFRSQLAESPQAEEARRYLADRDIDGEAAGRFGIGYAPADPNALRSYLATLGFDDQRLLEAGLTVVHDDSNAAPRVRFRDRIMFPIVDEAGHHVGFGARALGSQQPKYLNSPESEVFRKRQTLYGLNSARNAIRRAQRAIVVEGYMDAIRLVLSGLEEVVAPLGTALTDEQAQLLVRYSSSVYLLYDNDEAGLKATFRSGRELLRHGAEVRVVTLPPGADGKDPDSFIRSHGVEVLEAQIADSIDLFDRQIQIIERRGWFGDIKGRRSAIDKLIPTIRAAVDPLMRDLYLTRLSEAAHVDKETLVAEVERGDAGYGGRRVTQEVQRTGDWQRADGVPPPAGDGWDGAGGTHAGDNQGQDGWKSRRKGRARGRGDGWRTNPAPVSRWHEEPVERALLRVMVADQSVVERFAERFGAGDLRDGVYREIFTALLQAGYEDNPGTLAAALSDGAARVYQELINSDAGAVEGTDLELTFARLTARPIEERIVTIREALARAPREEQDVLLRERMELEKELRALLPVRNIRKS